MGQGDIDRHVDRIRRALERAGTAAARLEHLAARHAALATEVRSAIAEIDLALGSRSNG
ncbi:MAG: hypothetical protein SNJ63_10605 [Sphingomonadaceae bacterium]